MNSLDRFREKLAPLNRGEAKFAKLDGLSLGWQVGVFAISVLAIYFRCPSDISHAQFFAEDGQAWYANAYNSGGLHALLLPCTNYLVIVQRLGAWLSLFFAFATAPLIMALIGTVLQWLPVAILLSPRCRRWASLSLRVFFAAIYIAMPNASEIHVVLTNSMWHLALAAILLAFAAPPQSWVGRLFDTVIFALISLTGPFGILLAPVVLLFWYVRRQRWSLAAFGLLSLGGCVQIYVMHHYGNRASGPLGATPGLFIRLTGGNVFVAGILGRLAWPKLLPTSLLLASFLAGLSIIIYFWWHSNLELRLFAACCGGIFLAALRSPLASANPFGLWYSLLETAGTRYWFFPTLLFLWACCWCSLSAPARPWRFAGALALLLLPVGIVHDWRYPSFPDEHLALYQERLQQAAPGQHIVIPIAPTPWTMELVKRSH